MLKAELVVFYQFHNENHLTGSKIKTFDPIQAAAGFTVKIHANTGFGFKVVGFFAVGTRAIEKI
ncbi:MAG: hypothetical protein IIA63_09275 [Nitrospinae bacterium]|nr:hypothetical protein [Nitrospinota bacterium]